MSEDTVGPFCSVDYSVDVAVEQWTVWCDIYWYFAYCVQVADKVRTKSSSGRPESPSLSVYATLRTPRTTSSTHVSSPSTSSPTPNSTSTPTSSRLYSPSLSAGFRAFPASSSSRRPGVGAAATTDGPGKRPSTFDQRKSSSTLRTNSPAAGKQIAALHSTFFQSSGHDVDFWMTNRCRLEYFLRVHIYVVH